jgi:hypothetical protein
MPMTWWRRALKLREPFRLFGERTQHHFRFLVDDYGFRVIGGDVAAYEAWVVFENGTTRVTVSYEIGSAPWVEIARLERAGAKVVVRDETSLELLLHTRGRPDPFAGRVHADIPDDELDRMLAVKAANLREEAGELLRGDFSSIAPPQ